MSVFVTKTYYGCIDAATDQASKYGARLDNRTIIFCEDKLTLSVEKALVLKAGGGFGCEVLSFGRYVTKFTPNRKTLSKEGASMVIKKLLSQNSTSLKTLARLGASPALATKTAELIAQLKSAKITPSDLFNCLDDCPKNVGSKISDIALIFDKYEQFLKQEGFTDSNNALEDMLDALNLDKDLPFTNIIIAGYSSITKQSCEIIKTLWTKARSCHFFAVSGDNCDLYTNEFLNFVLTLTGNQPIYIDERLNKECQLISERLFKAENFAKVGLYSDKVHFFEANNPVDEVEFLACSIKKLVIDNKAKYSDFAVGVGALNDYSLLIERKFADYNIPFFTDRKRKLSSHPLYKLVCSTLRCALKKSGMDEIKKVINNSLFIEEKNLSDKIIRYFAEKSITYSTFLKNLPDFSQDAYNLYLQAKWNLLANFILDFPKKAKAEDFINKLEKFINSCGISFSENAEKGVNSLANKLSSYCEEEHRSFLESGIVKFGEILSEIKNILGEDLLSGEEFYKILSSGCDACEISLIPEYLDCVYVSELKNCRFKKYDYLFAIGLSGDIPSVKADTALLIDSEISKLEKLSLCIEPKIRVVNKREKEACAISLCSFEKGLFLSYSLLSAQGVALAKSEIIDYLIKIFSSETNTANVLTTAKINANIDDFGDYPYIGIRPALLSLAKKAVHGENVDFTSTAFYQALKDYGEEWLVNEADELIKKSGEEKIFYLKTPINNYFKDGMVSASTIETYYACPYKCYLKYGVGLADSISPDIQTRDVGNVMHDLVEKFMGEVDSLENNEQCAEKAKELFDEIFKKEEYKRFLSRPDYSYSAELLKGEAVRLCTNLYNEHKNSDFRPIGREIWFSDWSNGPYKAYKLPTKNGLYKLFGKVDRIDKYKNFVRIIDYKTGKAEDKIKNEKFYTGQNLQLYLYMNAFAINGDKPAGAYYYAVSDNFVKEDVHTISMHGTTLLDEEILRATDHTLENNKSSSVIKAKLSNSASSLNNVSGSVADERVFLGYMNYAKFLASKAIDDISSGVAVPSPCKNTCDYCEFGAMCGYDEEVGFSKRKITGVKSSTIVDAAEKYQFERSEKDNLTKTSSSSKYEGK